MSIAEQFSGLPMDNLIGGPLRAAADASTQLANSTADFINRVGFDKDGKARTVAFAYQQRSVNEDGTSNLDEMKVEVPMLAIVPIPNLQIDEVNILFDMEVKQSEKSESSMDLSASAQASLNLGIFKVNVSGSVSAHQSNTRSSDNSAKYHVDVRATNHGTPEGLARVLDMMAANVAPALVGSSLKDANGQDLTEAARVKSERLKALRQEISQIESRLRAAREGFDNNLQQLKKVAGSQLNIYQSGVIKLMNTLEDADKKLKEAKTDAEKEAAMALKEENDRKSAAYGQAMDTVNQSFNAFNNQVSDFIKMIADSGTEPQGVSEIFALRAFDEKAGEAADYKDSESYYAAMAAAQKSAVASQRNITQIETELYEKKAEYSDAVAGRAPAALPGQAESKPEPAKKPSPEK